MRPTRHRISPPAGGDKQAARRGPEDRFLKIPNIRTLRKYHRIARVGEIARRYFAMNAFDGVLTILGVLVGSYFGGIRQAGSVVTLGLAASFAMGVSGFYGAYMTEKAERRRALDELEQSTLSDLSDTDISHASTYAAVAVAVIDGLSPFAAAAIAVSPFFFGGALEVHTAYTVAIVLAFLELFALGAYLGAISRERMILAGFKMMVAGLICVVVAYLLGSAA
jgi:predicted membrane protein (TIGR00267 family)